MCFSCAKISILLLILNNFHFILSIFPPFAVKYLAHIIIWSLKLVRYSRFVANTQGTIHYYKVVLTKSHRKNQQNATM